MKKITKLFVASILAALLSHTGAFAGIDANPFPQPLAQSKALQIAAASQCDTSCSTTFQSCKHEVVKECEGCDSTDWQQCTNQLRQCRSNCVNQGHCVTMGDEVVCP